MGSPLSTGSAHSRAFAGLSLAATLLGSLTSLLMLWLLVKTKRWNGHVLLITTMTVFQTIYDISFYTAVVDVHNAYVTVPSNVAQIVGGMGGSLISNAIAGIAFFVIWRRRSFPIFACYPYILAVVLLAAAADATMFLLSVLYRRLEYLADYSVLGFYYYARLVSICLNFVLALLTAWQIRRTRSGKAADLLSHSERTMNQLALRLFYYPLVQAVSRSGAAWYEMQYGYDFDRSRGYDFSPAHTSNWAFAAQCTMALSMPAASVGYLCIFLVMQPTAYDRFRDLLRCRTTKEVQDDSAHLLASLGASADEDEDSDEGDDEELVSSSRQSLVSTPTAFSDL